MLVVVLAVVVGGCGGGRRSGNALTGTATVQDDWVVAATAPPTAIYVADFVAPPGSVKPPGGVVGAVEQAVEERPHLLGTGVVDRRVAGDMPTGEEVGATLSRSITQSLQGQGLACPVYRLASGAPQPPSGWVVTGRLVAIDPGERAERAAVGFGAGEATSEVEVDVDEVGSGTPTRVLQIGAQAESGKAPGGAATKNPYAIAAKFVLGRNATQRDVERMGEAVAAEIAKQARAAGEPQAP